MGSRHLVGFIAFLPIPESSRGASCPPPVLAPGPALGSRPRVALSSDRVPSLYPRSRPGGTGRPRCRGGPATTPRPGLRQLPLAGGEDLPVAAFQSILRRDVTDRTVQADFMVMGDVRRHDPQRVVQAQRRLDPDALALEGLVPPLDLPVALGIV